MVFAFDFGKVLEWSPSLRNLCRDMLACNHQVYVISAQGTEDAAAVSRKTIDTWDIPFTGILFVIDGTPLTVDGVVEYQIGMKKLAAMAQVGASVLFDDNPYICRAVRDHGKTAVQIIPRDERG